MQPQATATTSNGSFQNQPLAAAVPPVRKGRKRGISALLQDVTNLAEPHCRGAQLRARAAMQSQQKHSAPQGSSTEGAWARYRCDASDTSAESASQEPATLFELLGHKRDC